MWFIPLATRIIPYPPNFRRIAARIIEPATGASTWALGSHKCTRYKGSFTEKARINKNDIKYDVKHSMLLSWRIKKLALPTSLERIIIDTSRGRDANTV